MAAKKNTHKGTVSMTAAELVRAGYTPKQAWKMAEMDIDNELPKVRKGRKPRGESK
jgi:hypothetical protein